MMRKFNQLFLSLLIFGVALQVTAQIKPASTVPPVRTCGTPVLPDDYEHWIQPLISLGSPRAVYTIPVVVHIIHNGETVGSGSNISATQVQSQIDALNRDYRKLNTDIGSVPSTWTSTAADCQVNFCLAVTDPSGNPMAEPGIDRINRSTAGFSAPPYTDTYTDATIKPATIWNTSQYLNIWVESLGGGLLGYATFPSGSTLTGLSAPYGTTTSDGVVILNSAFGTVGSVASPYNLGRTATHEIGHWLGLRHIGGDQSGGCGNDFCTDTPTQKGGTTAAGTGNDYGQNYGCPTHPLVRSGECSGTTAEMFMNYMDYVDDACMYMFSNDQATRIQTCLANSPMRVAVASSGKCNPTYALDAGITTIVKPTGSSCVGTFAPIVTLKNFGSTTLTSVSIKYKVDAGATSTFAWTGSLTTGSSTNVTLPTITVATGAHTFTAFTNAPNGGTDGYTTNDTQTGSFTITTSTSGAALPFSEGFEGTTFAPTGWSIVNPDANGTWTRTTTASGFGTSTACTRFDNLTPTTSIAGQSDYLVTPALSFASASGTLQMTFDVAYARYNATYYDSLNVYITTDCGASWTRLYNKGGTGLATAPDNTGTFVPTAAQWRTETINLNSYIGLNPIQIRFENKSGWGQMLYVDNVNLSYTGSTPTANFTGSPTTVCAGQTVTYTNTTTGGATSYAWTFPGGTPGTSTATNPTITYNTAGTYNVTLVATNASGSNTNTKTGYITVTALPAATATNTGPVCAGSSFTISTPAVTGATYSWSGPAGYTSSTRNPTITGATSAMAGTYTVTVTAGGCSNTSSTTVTVNPAPAATATNTGGYCAGQTISLSTPTVAGATYSWTGPGGYTSSLQNPTRASATTAMAGTYTVTVTAGGCSATSSTVVSVTNPPAAAATNTGPVCEGTSFSLNTTAVTGATYSWSGPAAYTASVQNPTVTGTTTAMSGVYTVTVTKAGCSSTSSTTVTVNPTPAAAAANTGPYCQGATINLSTTTVAGATYSWTGPGTYSSTAQNPTRASSTTGMTGTYVVTVTLGSCTATSSTVVTVNGLPAAAATNTGPVCEGQSFSLNTTSVSAATYSWTGPGGYTASIRNPTISGATLAMAGTYTVTVTKTATGCSKTSSTTVVINPGPTSSATNTGPVCEGTALGLNTPTVASATYSWTGPGGYTSSSQNPVISAPTSTSSGAYTVIVTVGSCSTTSTTTALVNALPAASAANDGPVCAGSPLNLNTTAVSGATYSWSGPAGFTSSSQNPSIASVSSAASGTYTVTVTNAGCSNTSSTNVTVNPAPNASATNDGPVCDGGNINLGTPAVAGATYSWSGPGGYTSSVQNPVLSAVTSATAGTYTVSVTDGSGCTGTSSTNVTVNALPAASAGSDVSICPGENTTLSASGGGTYSWSPGTSLSATNIANPVATPSGTTAYTVTVSNGTCSNTASVTVTVFPAPVTPTISISGSLLTATPSTGGYTYQWFLNGTPISGATSATHTLTSNGNYTVEITDANGCSSTSSAFSYNGQGIFEYESNNGFSLYPNPNNGQFTITFKQAVEQDCRLTIYDGIGQVVYNNSVKPTGKNNSVNIQAGNLARGTYMVMVTNGNNRYYQKLVINN